MQNLVLELKKELGVIDSIKVYNTYSNLFEYSDEHADESLLIEQIRPFGSMETLEYLFFEHEKVKLVLVRKDVLIAIVRLSEKKISNQIIFLHKTKVFLNNFHKILFK